MSNSKNGFKKFLCSSAGKAVMIIVGYLVILLGFLLCFHIMSSNPGENFFVFVIVAELIFAIFGWRALNKITPRYFLILPIIGWIIFFFVKLLLSMLIGSFVAPFVVSKGIANIVQKSMKAQIKHEEATKSTSDTVIEPEPNAPPTPSAASNIESPTHTRTMSAEEQHNNIQLLKEYKKLLDCGIITQEEYDSKKQSLLQIDATSSSLSCSDGLSSTFSSDSQVNDSTIQTVNEEVSECSTVTNQPIEDGQKITPDEEEKKNKKKKKPFRKLLLSTFILLLVIAVVAVVALQVPAIKYAAAVALMEYDKEDIAVILFESLGNYENSIIYLNQIKYQEAIHLAKTDNYSSAAKLLQSSGASLQVDSYTFDENNNCTKEANFSPDGSESSNEFRYYYEYYNDKYLITQKESVGDYYPISAYYYNWDGTLYQEVTYNSSNQTITLTYIYNDFGQCTKIEKSEQTFWSDNTILFQFDYLETFDYDYQGNCIEHAIYSINPVTHEKDDTLYTYDYTYDDNGNQIKAVFTIYGGLTEDMRGKSVTTHYTYDENNLCIESEIIAYNGTTLIKNHYNSEKQLIAKYSSHSSGSAEFTSYVYDERGNCIKQINIHTDND